MVIAKRGGMVIERSGGSIEVDKMFVAAATVMFDAVYVPGGDHTESLIANGDAVHFVNEAYRHCKPIAASGEGVRLLQESRLPDLPDSLSGGGMTKDKGVVIVNQVNEAISRAIVQAISYHRHWNRMQKVSVSACLR